MLCVVSAALLSRTRMLAPARVGPLSRTTGVRDSSSKRFPLTPYSKDKVEQRKRKPHRSWKSWNDPALVPKFLRYAERAARELGVVDDLASFDEAAAAFPNPCPIIVATLVERANVVMRDVHHWESDFLLYKEQRNEAEAKSYPPQYIDMLTAASKVVEGGDDDGGDVGGGGAPGKASTASGDPLVAFYEGSAGGGDEASEQQRQQNGGGTTAGLAIAPRTTPADDIGDTRSLDRAYTQRLTLLVRDAQTGEWGLPEGVRLDGEPMVQAAERCLRAAWGPDPALDLWFIGRAPVGHVLRVHPPDVQAATGTYGAKVFVYRAEIIAGRFRLPAPAPAGEPQPRYSDFGWYSRDEAEAVLARPLWKYLHQVMAAGAGEQFAREAAWKERIAARGLTVAQATGRRAFRVEQARLAFAAAYRAKASGEQRVPPPTGFRLPAVATRAQAAVAAMPWAGGGQSDAKASSLAAEGFAYRARVADQKKRSAALARELATPSAVAVAALRRKQKLAAQAQEGPA